MNKGSVLVLSLLIVAVLLMIGGIFLGLTISNYNMLYISSLSESSFWIAKAGVSQAIHDTKRYMFDKEVFLSFQSKWINGVKLDNGTYKVAIASVKGLGTREIIIISHGFDKEGRESSALLTRMQIYCPSDYIYFFNGNGIISNYGPRKSIYGSIHANGSLFLDTGPGGIHQGWLRIMKSDSESFRGPTVGATGIIFRGSASDIWAGYDPNEYYVPESKIIVGVGNIEQAMAGFDTASNYTRGFTYGTENNNLDKSKFYITKFNKGGTYGPDPNQPVPAYPFGNEPDITFPVKRADGTTEHLLLDGKHGAYNIKIPSKDKISSYFEPFIDKKFKIDYSNLLGGKTVEFYNDSFLKKVPLTKVSDRTYKFENKGTEPIGYVRYDNMWRTSSYPPLGSVVHTESPIFPPTLNYYRADYVLFQDRGVSNVTVGGSQLNYGTQYLFFPVIYEYPNQIVFTQASGIGAGQVGAEVRAEKLKYIYGTKDSKNYTYEFEISPITYIINGDTITFRSTVGNQGDIILYMKGQYEGEKRDDKLEYKTASFLSSSTITTIKEYNYNFNSSGGNYGGDSRFVKSSGAPVNFGTKYDEVLTTEVKSSGYSYDSNSGRINYSDSGNPVIIKSKPLLSYDTTNNRYWIGLPFVWLPVANMYYSASNISVSMTDTNTPPTTITGIGVIVAIVDSSGKFVNKNTGVSPETTQSNIILTYDTDYTISGSGSNSTYAYPGYVQLSQSISTQIPVGGNVLISYASNYREITGITGTVQTPEYYGVIPCIDKYVKVVSMDLSIINENNYPKDGIIYSEVPLIVFGIPKKKITVVCKEEVYVSSINYSYKDNSGNWVSSSLVDNDANAKPVAIISGKGIFAYHGANTKSISLPTDSKDGIITLNKVVLWTSSNDIFSFGTSWTIVNQDGSSSTGINKIRFLIGSQIFGNSFAVTETNDPYNQKYYIDTRNHVPLNYGVSSTNINMLRYPESFREDLTPQIPFDIQILNYRSISVDKVDSFIKIQKSKLEQGNISNEVYNQSLNNLLN